MYYETEIKYRKSWVNWLASFRVGDKKEIDYADKSKIAISVSNNFHKKEIARFEFSFETDEKGKRKYFLTRIK